MIRQFGHGKVRRSNVVHRSGTVRLWEAVTPSPVARPGLRGWPGSLTDFSVVLTGLAGGEVVVAAGLLITSTLLTVFLAGPILRLLQTRLTDGAGG
jgi:hypothetical protein